MEYDLKLENGRPKRNGKRGGPLVSLGEADINRSIIITRKERLTQPWVEHELPPLFDHRSDGFRLDGHRGIAEAER
jgi:hypothetical protein